MDIGYHTITWGGVVGDATGVTSVKDLFYRANGDMDQALLDISAAGYAGVEMFDGNVEAYADDVSRLRGELDDHHLKLVSVYSGANFIYADVLPDELHRIERAAVLGAAVGAAHLVVGGGARRAVGTTEQDYDLLGTALDLVVDIAEANGLAASFHPHLSTIVEGPDEVRKVLERSRIGFCPDTAHLSAGGGDPVRLVEQYAARVTHVHLKDWRPPADFLPLGEGAVDVAGVVGALRAATYDGWLIVELDDYPGDPAEAARISKRHLDAILFEQDLS